MSNQLRALIPVVALSAVLIGLPGISGRPGTARAVAAEQANACGCYRDSSGSCLCGRKTKCGCPGECEPKGCEEKRDKQIKKEIEAETRKAQEAGRKHAESRTASRPAPPPEPEEPAAPSRTVRPKPKRPVVKLSAPQRKEFLRLLDIYLAEDPDHRSQTLDQARSSVKSAGP